MICLMMRAGLLHACKGVLGGFAASVSARARHRRVFSCDLDAAKSDLFEFLTRGTI